MVKTPKLTTSDRSKLTTKTAGEDFQYIHHKPIRIYFVKYPSQSEWKNQLSHLKLRFKSDSEKPGAIEKTFLGGCGRVK